MICKDLCNYLDSLLNISSIPDSSLNGLQVGDFNSSIETVAFAVDAALETIEKAVELKADMLFVHHGIFWGRCYSITGNSYKRFSHLLNNNLGLYAAHLPLDLHPQWGNNAQLAKTLGLESILPFGDYKGIKIGFKGQFPHPQTIDQILEKLSLSREKCLKIYDFGKQAIETVAIVSGGAVDEISQAVCENVDLYITGDASHEVFHLCKENSINMISMGHYESETYGVKAIAKLIEKEHNLKTIFIDCPTGL